MCFYRKETMVPLTLGSLLGDTFVKVTSKYRYPSPPEVGR